MTDPARANLSLADPVAPEPHSEATDVEVIPLVLRYQGGDPEALATLHSRLEPIIRSFLRRYRSWTLPGTLTYQDLGQQSWLILAELATRWRPHGSFLAYFFKSFPRDLRRYLQHAGASRRSALVQVISLPHHEVVVEVERLNAAPPPDDGTGWPESLEALSASQRAALVLRAGEGREFSEIARLLGTSPATANRLYHQALAQVRNAEGGPDPQTLNAPAREAERLVRALHAMAGPGGKAPGRRRLVEATGLTRARCIALLGQLAAVGALLDRGPTHAGRLADRTVEQTLRRLEEFEE